jgi:predicted hydrocarbon binding protein
VQLVDYYADRFTKICLGEEVPKLRPTYGDKIDLGSTRLELALLMAYSPEVRLLVYDIGKNVGKALATRLVERGILTEFLDGGIRNPLGEFSRQKLPDGTFRVRVGGNVFAEGLPNVGVRFDRFLAGVLASLFSIEVGDAMGASERECYASGAKACEFTVAPLHARLETSKTLQHEDWETAMEKILPEYVRRDATENYTKIRQSLEDEVDISVLRLLSSAIFTYSPEVKAWLYQLGKKAGIMSAELESRGIKGRLMGLMFVLTLMLKGDLTIRGKEGAFRIQRKGKNVFDFTIYECAQCYGLPIFDEPVGYISAGFAAGRFEKATGRMMGAREIKCAGKGDPYCVFEVKPLE